LKSIFLFRVCKGILLILNILVLDRAAPLNRPLILNFKPLTKEYFEFINIIRDRLIQVKKKLCFFQIT